MMEIAQGARLRGMDVDEEHLPEFIVGLSREIDEAWQDKDKNTLEGQQKVLAKVGEVSTNVVAKAIEMSRAEGETAEIGKKVLEYSVTPSIVKSIDNLGPDANVPALLAIGFKEAERLAGEPNPIGGIQNLASGLAMRVGNLVTRANP